MAITVVGIDGVISLPIAGVGTVCAAMILYVYDCSTSVRRWISCSSFILKSVTVRRRSSMTSASGGYDMLIPSSELSKIIKCKKYFHERIQQPKKQAPGVASMNPLLI